jgi:hypothetical protein
VTAKWELVAPFTWAPKVSVRKIRDSLDGENSVATGLNVYYGLMELASDHQSATFEATYATVAMRTGLSSKTVQRRVKDLIELGLVEMEVPKLKAPCRYTMILPERTPCPNDKTPSPDDRTQPETGHESNIRIKKEESIEEKHNGAAAPGVSVETIYEAYPRKIGKRVALKAITAAIKRGIAPEKLLELTRQYAEAVKGGDLQFVPHPSTFFNQDRFNDDPSTWRIRSTVKQGPSASIGTANEGSASDYVNVGKITGLETQPTETPKPIKPPTEPQTTTEEPRKVTAEDWKAFRATL